MSPQHPQKFRRDIEGLRAVAVLLVLLFHAKLPIFPGGYVGVDIFFVISGFLITGNLLREAKKTGGISLTQFYARRARRLLPAAAAVILFTAAITFAFAPLSQQQVFAWDVVAAAAYIVNWRFAERSVDYLAEDVGLSPVLHFWSLSVEEQFYFLWPLLIMGAAWIARKRGRSITGIATSALALVILPSFAYSFYYTTQSPGEAFFVTTTRLWELGIGALLAVHERTFETLPRKVKEAMSWLGLGLIIYAALQFDQETSWPGWRAAFPVIATLALIGSGTDQSDLGVSRILSIRPMTWLGGISYSVYLWHWPVLVAGQAWLGLEGVLSGTVLVIVSIFPAWMSFRLVEDPIRRGQWIGTSPTAGLRLGFALSLVIACTGLSLTMTRKNSQEIKVSLHVKGADLLVHPIDAGAQALHGKSSANRAPFAEIVPNPILAPKDVPEGQECQGTVRDADPIWCDAGSPQGTRTIFVIGDSKIRQYRDVLDKIGQAKKWRLRFATKSACPFTAAMALINGKPYSTCLEHGRAVLDRIERERPDAVLVSQRTRSALAPTKLPQANHQVMIDGLVAYWSRIQKIGVQVIVLNDNPAPHSVGMVYECVASHPTELRRCAFDRSKGIQLSAAPVLMAAVERVAGAQFLDLTTTICPNEVCDAVIGGVLVYRQGSHITNSYALSMAPILAEQIEQALAVR